LVLVQVIEFFQRVETLISSAKFLASMYFHEVVHFSVHGGGGIFPGNLGGNIKFPPPRNSTHLPQKFRGPEIPPQARNFRPRARIFAPSN
jgi:hypothetical protein